MSSAAPAAPLALVKAAYSHFKQTAQTQVKKVELGQKTNASELRVLRHALNDFTQSVFIQARRHLLVSGQEEALDANLPAAVEAAKAQFKAARVRLNEEQNRSASIIDQMLRAPLSHLNDDGTEKDEAVNPFKGVDLTGLPLSTEEMDRVVARQSQLQQMVQTLQKEMPDVLQSAVDVDSYLSARSTQPQSEEVRAILTKLNQDLAKGKKGAKGQTAAAKKKAESEATGSGGKIPKSPTARLNARLSSKPY